MHATTRPLALGAAVAAAAAIVLVGSAGGQTPAAPPPAVDSPNQCVLEVGSRSWCGDNEPADRAKLAAPSDVAVARDGTVVIADTMNNVVRRVRPNGIITTIAGTGAEGSAVPRRAADEVGFDAPGGVASLPDGGVLVADTGNDAVRSISAMGVVRTLVGPSGPIRADLEAPGDVTTLPDGGYLIADTGNHRVLRVSATGSVEAVAGTRQGGYAGDGGSAATAQLRGPTQVSAAPDGTLLIADTGNGAVRRVLPSGVIETVTGGLRAPEGVLGLPGGAVVVAGAAGLLRVEPDGTRVRIAGGPRRGYNHDTGTALTLRFDGIAQLAVGADGRILFAERGSDRIRALHATGVVATLAGSGKPRAAEMSGIPAGAFPAELLRAANAAGTRPRPTARGAGATSSCERYHPRYGQFTLVPPDRGTLRTRARSARRGRKRLQLRFANSRGAFVTIRVSRRGTVAGRSPTRRFRGRRRPHTIRIQGRFTRNRNYVARLYGVSVRGRIRRCDVKHVRVR